MLWWSKEETELLWDGFALFINFCHYSFPIGLNFPVFKIVFNDCSDD